MPLRQNVLAPILALLVTLGASSVRAQRFQGGGEMPKVPLSKIGTKYYRVMGSMPKKELAEYARYMDRLGKEYYRLMKGLGGDVDERFLVAVWKHQREYMQFVGPAGTNSGGIFMAHRQTLSTFIEGQPKERVLSVLRHEGFHQFFYHYIGVGRPIWVNEGLAVYFENSMLVDGKMLMGDTPPHYLMVLKAARKTGNLPSLETMMTMSHEQWNTNLRSGSAMGQLQYPAAWSIVHFLRHGAGDDGRKMLTRYLKAINNPRMTPERALHKAFGKGRSLRIFQKKWAEYIDKMEPSPTFQSREQLEKIVRVLRALHGRGTDFTQFETTGELLDFMKDKGVAPGNVEALFVCPGDDADKDPRTSYEYSTVEIEGKHYPVLTSKHFKKLYVRIVYEKTEGGGIAPSVEIVGR